MKFLFVAYRWGSDLVGGAEIHHRRLVHDLIALGHEVEVWTTTGRNIEPVAHWGVLWESGYDPGVREEDGVRVRRFPIDRGNRKAIGLAAKYLQRAVENEWQRADIEPLLEVHRRSAPAEPRVELLHGWHHVEVSHAGFLSRWSARTGHVLLSPAEVGGTVWVAGNAPRPTSLVWSGGDDVRHREQLDGPFDLKLDVPPGGRLALEVNPPWRPLTDHRSLGLYVNSIRWQPRGTETVVEADFWNDLRAIGRRHPEVWQDFLWKLAEGRSPRLGKIFDWVRGPRSPALRAALRQPPAGTDAVIAANLPWSTLPVAVRECPLPVFAMALWHVEDDYYYWPHYMEACRNARAVLANTPWSAERFFAPRGIRSAFVGPGVPLPDSGTESSPAAEWKAAHGIGADEAVVLSVSRKSPEKRYDAVASAVHRLRAQGRRVRFVLIGPDLDFRKLPEGSLHLGRVDDDALQAAYRACDAFVLMSDSESFGMVLVEAWMHGKPVVANRHCGPTASLVREGEDGFLAADAGELAGVLTRLLDDAGLRERLGAAGRARATVEFTQRAATERLLALLDGAL